MDYYERTIFNGIMGIQRGEQPGVMLYMLPLGPGVSKARSYHGWGNKFDSFWCCYGTGNSPFMFYVLLTAAFLAACTLHSTGQKTVKKVLT